MSKLSLQHRSLLSTNSSLTYTTQNPRKMPPKQNHDPPHLLPGSTIEVTSDEEGFKGSWFAAKLLKRANRKSPTYVIEYATLFQDEAGTKPLKETVTAAQIRPVPPETRETVFKVGDEVDGFYNDGWWEGKVLGVEAERVEVFFEGSAERIWFGKDSLRVHRVWTNGNWVPPVQEDRQGFEVEEDMVNSGKENIEKADEGEKVNSGKENIEKADEGEKVNSGKENIEKADEGEKVNSGKENIEKADEGEKVNSGKENIEKADEGEKVNSGKENIEKADEGEKLPIEGGGGSDKEKSDKEKEDGTFDYFGSLKLPIEDDGNSDQEKSEKGKEHEKLTLSRTRKRRLASPKQADPSHLKPGAAVEISSYDTGFRGSWFIGTIIRSLSKKKPAKFLVEYKTLFLDDAGKNHLRETLNEYQLRPMQPMEKQPREFKFGDEVDAYFNDGWWEGSITKELGGGKFNVYFRPSKEQLEFGKESLRIHREWNDGAWDPPIEDENEGIEENEEDNEEVPFTNMSSGEDMFTFGKGALVEVSSDEDGFRGAWFSATVIEPIGKDKYVIEYTTLRTDDDTAFLREEVDSQHIRPYPPHIVGKARLKVHQEVDAFHNDAWWIGVISKVLKGGSRYLVFFRDTNEELEFEHSDLRLHQDWIGGKWAVASKDLRL